MATQGRRLASSEQTHRQTADVKNCSKVNFFKALNIVICWVVLALIVYD